MVRWLRQHDQSSCGPISIINAAKWCGIPVSEKKTLRKLRQDCSCKRKQGTYYPGMILGLSNYVKYLDFGIVSKLTIKKIDRHLKNGGAAIFGLYWIIQNKKYAHSVLCVGKTKKSYKIINYSGIHSDALQYKSNSSIRSKLKLAMKSEKSHAVIFLDKV